MSDQLLCDLVLAKCTFLQINVNLIILVCVGYRTRRTVYIVVKLFYFVSIATVAICSSLNMLRSINCVHIVYWLCVLTLLDVDFQNTVTTTSLLL